jgi:hypothetical protein
LVDLIVELERDARVAPVAGAVLMGLSVRWPLAGEAVGRDVVAEGAGVSILLVEERWAAEPDPLRVGEVCAEAVVTPTAKAAKTRRLFIKRRLKTRKGIPVLTTFQRLSLVVKCYCLAW